MDIKEYFKKLVFRIFRGLVDDKFQLESFYKKYDLNSDEQYLFILSVKEINKIDQDEIDKNEKLKQSAKKGISWFGNKLKSLSLPDISKTDIQNDLNKLKDNIEDDPDKKEEEKKKELELVDKIDSEKKKMEELIRKYEGIQKINSDKLKETELDRDNIFKASNELIKNLEKFKKSRTELSIKAKELLMDRYRQLNIKKKMKEEAMNDMIIQNEKINIALEKLKKDHEEKIKEMKDMENMEIQLINQRKILEEKKMKLELDKISMDSKKKLLDAREKRLNQTQEELNNIDKQNKRTIRKPYIEKKSINNQNIITPKSKLSSFDTLERTIRDKNTTEIQSDYNDYTDSDSIRSGEKNVKKTVRKKKKNKKRKKKKSLFNFL